MKGIASDCGDAIWNSDGYQRETISKAIATKLSETSWDIE
jgi:hypothetical protein